VYPFERVQDIIDFSKYNLLICFGNVWNCAGKFVKATCQKL
jgi:hypothetical protein